MGGSSNSRSQRHVAQKSLSALLLVAWLILVIAKLCLESSKLVR